MRELRNLSLRLRLILLFSVLALLTWLIASGVAWHQTRKHINEVFDTQQMLFAKRLAATGLGDRLNLQRCRTAGHQKNGPQRFARPYR